MRFYKVQNNTLEFPSVEVTKLQPGHVYNIKDLLETGKWKDERQVYFYEYNAPHSVWISADSVGRMPFAIQVNDSVRDEFPSHCLAKVILNEGNFLIHAHTNTDAGTDNLEEATTIFVFRIKDTNPDITNSIGNVSINIELINSFKMNDIIIAGHGILENAINHVFTVWNSAFGDYLTPKYSFNPGRVMTNRLFVRNEEGELVSHLDNGSKLVLNRNSFARNVVPGAFDTDIHEAIFMRCFFSKKFKNEPMIFVDGVALPMITLDDIPEYIEASSGIDMKMASSTIKKITLKNGFEFYAINNSGRSETRPIYKTTTNFATFALNNYELQHKSFSTDLSFH